MYEVQKAVRECGAYSSAVPTHIEREFGHEVPIGARESSVNSVQWHLVVRGSIEDWQMAAWKVVQENILPWGVLALMVVPGGCWFL